MALKGITTKFGKAIWKLSTEAEGKKELFDGLEELVEGLVTLHGRALKLDIEKDKITANYKRFQIKVERLLKDYEKDQSKAGNLKQRVTYNTKLLQQVKELEGPLNAFANAIYEAASRASTPVVATFVEGIAVIGGIVAAFVVPGGNVGLATSALTSGVGVFMLLHQAYNSYSSNSTENELRRLAADTQKFILKVDELIWNLKNIETELEVEKQRDC